METLATHHSLNNTVEILTIPHSLRSKVETLATQHSLRSTVETLATQHSLRSTAETLATQHSLRSKVEILATQYSLRSTVETLATQHSLVTHQFHLWYRFGSSLNSLLADSHQQCGLYVDRIDESIINTGRLVKSVGPSIHRRLLAASWLVKVNINPKCLSTGQLENRIYVIPSKWELVKWYHSFIQYYVWRQVQSLLQNDAST